MAKFNNEVCFYTFSWHFLDGCLVFDFKNLMSISHPLLVSEIRIKTKFNIKLFATTKFLPTFV